MDKNKILEAACKNKQRGKEYENAAENRSTLVSVFVALVVGVGLFLIEYFVSGSANFGLLAVGATIAGVDFLYLGIKLGKTIYIVPGVFALLGALITIVIFIYQVVML